MQKQWLKVLTAVVVTVFMVTTIAEAQEEGQGRRRDREGRRDRQGGGRFGGGFGGRGGFGAPGDYMALLRMEAVQKELKVDEAQEKSIDELADKLRGERRGERPNFRDLSDDEREKFLAERRKEAEKRSEEAKKALAGILSGEQMTRLSQISIQVRGASALNDPEVAAKLEITDEQMGKIEAAEEENSQKMRTAMRELRDSDDRQAAFAKIGEMREEGQKNVLAVLTKEQQAKFEEMQGKKFEFPERRGRFGGRGGRERGDREGGRRERRNRDE